MFYIKFGNDTMRYDEADMAEIFSLHERMWLSEGKIVERTVRGKLVQIVDLEAWFARTSK